MKTPLFVVILASVASYGFAQTPTPPPPSDNQPDAQKSGEIVDPLGSKAYQNASRVAIMLHGYAEDNGGKLPAKLDDLVPAYITDKALISDLEFKAAGAELAKLSPDMIVLRHARDAKVRIKASQLQGIKRVAPEGAPSKEKAQ